MTARPATSSPRILETLLHALLILAGAGLVLRSAYQATAGMLASDECFHAWAAEWIATRRSIPEVFPELYGGFFYYYPPLLHFLGAAWIALFGKGALLLISPVLFGALFAVLATGALRATPWRAGVWAAVLLAAHGGMRAMAVRLYAEILVTLLVVIAVGLLIRLRREPGRGAALALGAITGLALLAKFNAWSLWVGLLVLAVVDGARGRRDAARFLALAAGIALAIVAPWLVRNHLLFGSAWYPLFAPGLDPVLYALNARKFSTPPAQFLAAIPGAIGFGPLALGAGALAAAALRKRWTVREGLIVAALVAMAITAFAPFSQARHLLPAIAVLTLMGAWGVLEALEGEANVRLGLSAAVLVVAIVAFTGPDLRRPADPPDWLREALPHVAASTPADARILSLWTYDTFYASRRTTTWPIAWGQQRHPVAMFLAPEPDSVIAHLRAEGITHVLSPTKLTPGRFDSANYPEIFLRAVGELLRTRELAVAWRSRDLVLLKVEAAAPDSAPARPRL